MNDMVGILEFKDLKEMFPSEDKFNKFLAANLDRLGSRLDMNLTLEKTEAEVGTFSADIVASDGQGTVVIECQLNPSDHDHLGKILTYAVNLDAVSAIWITPQPRPEHAAVVGYLNRSLPLRCYLIKVECVRVDDSRLTPLFTVVGAPDERSRDFGTTVKELTADQQSTRELQKEFCTKLLEVSNRKTDLFSGRSPLYGQAIGCGAGRSGLAWAYVYYANRGRVEFYLDTWHPDPEKRIEIIQEGFEFLQSHKEEIEKVFGEPLEWHESRGRVRRVQSSIEGGYESPKEEWEEICGKLVDRMVRLVECISPYLSQLP